MWAGEVVLSHESTQHTGLLSPAARIMPRGSERVSRGLGRSAAGGGACAGAPGAPPPASVPPGCPGANSTMRRAGCRRLPKERYLQAPPHRRQVWNTDLYLSVSRLP